MPSSRSILLRKLLPISNPYSKSQRNSLESCRGGNGEGTGEAAVLSPELPSSGSGGADGALLGKAADFAVPSTLLAACWNGSLNDDCCCCSTQFSFHHVPFTL